MFCRQVEWEYIVNQSAHYSIQTEKPAYDEEQMKMAHSRVGIREGKGVRGGGSGEVSSHDS